MSDLIVAFRDEFKADEVLINLRKLELEYLTVLNEQAVDCADYFPLTGFPILRLQAP